MQQAPSHVLMQSGNKTEKKNPNGTVLWNQYQSRYLIKTDLTNMCPFQRDVGDWNLSLCQAVSRGDFWVVLSCIWQDRSRKKVGEMGVLGWWVMDSGVSAMAFCLCSRDRKHLFSYGQMFSLVWSAAVVSSWYLGYCTLSCSSTAVSSPDQNAVRNHMFEPRFNFLCA